MDSIRKTDEALACPFCFPNFHVGSRSNGHVRLLISSRTHIFIIWDKFDLSNSQSGNRMQLDTIDRRILKILQENNQLTNLELAERVHLSPPTCLRRVRRLREEKVIVADVALLDPIAVGQTLFAFIEVVLERQHEEAQQAFELKMRKAEKVMQCYMVSGHADFMVVAQVADMPAYHRFVRSVLTNDPNIRNFRTLFAMNRSKFETRIAFESE